ncbi:MAG: GTP-binding protein [Ruminococcus sp.]|nr:GTP-binding protein [Ruminococcus sp.]
MFDRDVPVYLITGFLESGKTQFLDFTIQQDYFQIPEKTLLIVCEEGEEEYSEKGLAKSNTVMEVIEEPEDFNLDTLKMLDKKHKPGRVLIEFNPLWSVDKFYEMTLPRYWDMAQHIVVVDASTFQIYMNNMKSLFVEMIRGADMVIFNRCEADHPLANFRRSVKVVNAGAEVLFEDEEGEIEDIFGDEMPYDMDADVIEIEDIDFGIWYIDMMDRLEEYVGKTVKFKGQVLKSRDLNANFFVPGRMAMTCCADDTQFIGYVCKNQESKKLRMGSWVEVTATIKKEYMEVYHDEGPVLYATSIVPAEKPEQELVFFT